MTSHTPPREEYCVGNIESSPLTEGERECFKGNLYTLLTAEPGEYMPGQVSTGVDHEAVCHINVDRCKASRLSVEVYVEEDAIDADIRADERIPVVGPPTGSSDPSFLRDLGEPFEHLEADLIGEVVRALDLPTYQPELAKYDYGDDFGFFCTSAIERDDGSNFATFLLYAYIPRVTRALTGDESALADLKEAHAAD